MDYILGVEVVLDSNGRKNRGGDQMERLIKRHLEETGVKFYFEMYSKDIEKKWSYDLSSFSNKRWDFVAKTADKVFVIETNFYTGNGSKLNETARSYRKIAEDSSQIENFTFVWITDGEGWHKASKNLKETFLILPTLYNINDVEDGIFYKLFKIEKNK